jgi:hypothetical protein
LWIAEINLHFLGLFIPNAYATHDLLAHTAGRGIDQAPIVTVLSPEQILIQLHLNLVLDD